MRTKIGTLIFAWSIVGLCAFADPTMDEKAELESKVQGSFQGVQALLSTERTPRGAARDWIVAVTELEKAKLAAFKVCRGKVQSILTKAQIDKAEQLSKQDLEYNSAKAPPITKDLTDIYSSLQLTEKQKALLDEPIKQRDLAIAAANEKFLKDAEAHLSPAGLAKLKEALILDSLAKRPPTSK